MHMRHTLNWFSVMYSWWKPKPKTIYDTKEDGTKSHAVRDWKSDAGPKMSVDGASLIGPSLISAQTQRKI